MTLTRNLFVAGAFGAALVLAVGLHACSDSGSSTPNNTVAGCTPGSIQCGPNAVCTAAAVCACNAGFSDCDRTMGSPTGNGCECSNACSNGVCGTSACSPSAANSCGGDTSYCLGGTCTPCPNGLYNCDGLDTCEKQSACGGTVGGTCDTRVPNSCAGTGAFCDTDGKCKACGAGELNCDGVGGCECQSSCVGTSCQAPGGCVQECIDFIPTLCPQNPAANNRCEECLNDSHCTINPLSRGPRCNTSDIAGTGFNFCLCSSDADCASAKIGSKCYLTPSGTSDPNFKECGCKTDADCTNAPYVHCISGASQYVTGHCMKRCTTGADCMWSNVQGYCDPQTHRCDFDSAGYP